MNTIVQNILVFTTLALALTYLVRKFIWTPKQKSATKSCGNDNCGCS